MDRIDSADRGGILSDRYICRTENAGKRFIYGDNFVGRRSPYRRLDFVPVPGAAALRDRCISVPI